MKISMKDAYLIASGLVLALLFAGCANHPSDPACQSVAESETVLCDSNDYTTRRDRDYVLENEDPRRFVDSRNGNRARGNTRRSGPN